MQFIVNIDVDDIDRAVAFYQNGLGLQPDRRMFGGQVVEMSGGATAVYLIEQAAGSEAVAGAGIRREYTRHWTPVHLDFVVPDIEAARARAVSAGAVQEGGVKAYAWGRLATMSDPFGNGFCLLEFSGEGYARAG